MRTSSKVSKVFQNYNNAKLVLQAQVLYLNLLISFDLHQNSGLHILEYILTLYSPLEKQKLLRNNINNNNNTIAKSQIFKQKYFAKPI